ncbi:hypothetical protein GCM10009837_87080 [Streptomyces durmitorensis]|uniref:Lipoprotein n=1 Tax=Streptomyces durmitorensis TaxID=319947 RepID=A0ABY4Q2L1_9ACTN|nr:hypothetical protein [Streptomyces durmitorensis]UQT59930.1 hypothetical protein M4V62_35455 [Streptomyces durmitorensis]
MHRTTTAATLLVSVAVTAVSGCVSVERQPASGPSPASAPPPAPRTDGDSRPRVVEAPAREALELIGPPRGPAPRATGTAPSVPAAPPRAANPPQRSGPPPQRHGHRPEAVEPPVIPTAAPTNADLCALGKQYGGWRPGSPEAVICEDAYGH